MNSMNGYRGSSGENQQGTSSGSYRDQIPEGYKSYKMKNFDRNQNKVYQNQFKNVVPDSYLSRLAGGDQSMFEELEAPAHRQFQEQIGDISNRFSGAGMGARRGSGFQNTTNQAASDFAMNLQSQRLGMRNQALQELMQHSNTLLGQRPYDRFIQEKPQQTSWAETIGRLGGAVPGLVTSYFGGGSQGDALKGASSIFGGQSGGGSYNGYNDGNGSGRISTSSGFNPTMF